MSETLIVPESAVFENEPAAGTTEAAPAFAEGAMVANVYGSVEVAGEARILMAELERCGIRGLHGWRMGREQQVGEEIRRTEKR